MNTLNRPKFAINPMAFDAPYWTPEVYQVITGHRNPSYLNSLWIGTFWNLFSIPYRVLREVVVPLAKLRPVVALISAIVMPINVGFVMFRGLTGVVMAHKVELDVAVRSVVLSPQVCQLMIMQGVEESVIEIGKCIDIAEKEIKRRA